MTGHELHKLLDVFNIVSLRIYEVDQTQMFHLPSKLSTLIIDVSASFKRIESLLFADTSTLVNKEKNINKYKYFISFYNWCQTVGGMRRGGCREDEPITSYKPCQRELRLQIALKPPWRMTACVRPA